MMTLLLIAIGAFIGWYGHKLYLRFLYRQMARIKRAMRGGNGRRRRR